MKRALIGMTMIVTAGALLTAPVSAVAAPAALPAPSETSAPSPTAAPVIASDPASLRRVLAENSDDTIPNPDKRITFIAGLPRDSQALAAAARRASTPGRPGYRQFLTLKKAAATYGTSRSDITALRRATEPLDISVDIDPTGLFATLTATVHDWEQVYGQTMRVNWATPVNPFTYYAFVDAQTLDFAATPASLQPYVDFILAYEQEHVEQAPNVPSGNARPRGIWPIDDTLPWPLNTGSPLGPTCDQPALENLRVFTPTQTRDVYGLNRLEKTADSGRAARVVVITQSEGYDPSQIDAYTECFGLPAVTIQERRGLGVDRSFANLPGQDEETLLDLMTVIGALKTATDVTLVTEWQDLFGLSYLDGFARALDAYGDGVTVPDAVTFSYSGCEKTWTEGTVMAGVNGNPIRVMLEEVLALAAVVGTSVIASTGDAGSMMCPPALFPEITGASIGYPASSPWITAVGGTRLALGPGNRRTSEVVWNDVEYGISGASTGGPSSFYDRPWYQASISPRGPRTVPDISALASEYWPVFTDDRLVAVGGTSASAPFLAATFAILSARERLAGRPPLGFLNPWLYSLPPKALYDVTEGSNQLALPVGDGQFNAPPCCQALPGYDMATGLGTPKVVRMAQSITPAVPRR